ncbi:hypothetical protein NDU88_005452 [Pleurodeles waltl]|uniref:DDE Tnp4 domain-containing protein n=1 Tax=Pleurodeles waltl TaxID=8319 RepID=A0AAV7VLR2_PLEWA|nr:hypothetical protein NDU88_005452 [Pleurodeles waltl]
MEAATYPTLLRLCIPYADDNCDESDASWKLPRVLELTTSLGRLTTGDGSHVCRGATGPLVVLAVVAVAAVLAAVALAAVLAAGSVVAVLAAGSVAVQVAVFSAVQVGIDVDRRTRAEERYNEAHGRTRRVIERTFDLLKAGFRCLHMTGGSLYYSPKKVCQIILACCMLHNLALRRQVPFLQEDGPTGGLVGAVEPVDSEEEEAEEEDIDNKNNIIMQYFQ